MAFILVGVGLIISGLVWATMRTIRRGRMSQGHERATGEPRDTLEPKGRGRHLSPRTDLPGIALILLGIAFLFLGTR